MKIYYADDSGINPQPHPSSNTPFKDRYYFHTRRETVGFFNGPGLKHFGNRFQELLRKQISQLEIGHDWNEFADLYSFIQNLLISPAIEAMCGPTLIGQNPTFVDDFWKFDSNMLYFFRGCPRWLAQRAWKNRDRFLASLKNWHAYARENFEESCIEADGHDRFYGSPLMRSRQSYLPRIDPLDADALASQDLGLIWAENANSIPAVFWFIVELLQQPHLISQAWEEEVAASQSRSCLPDNQSMDIESLCSKPFLQSMYAETLRLHTSLFALRSAAHEDFMLGDWRIAKDELIAVDSRVAHMDKNVWNTGKATNENEEHHPLSQFWAARFLEYTDDPMSGPLRFSKKSKSRAAAADFFPDPDGHCRRFTMDGLSGAWLPFGGGSRQCPGRNFAKQEIILSFAVLASTFDIELLDGDKKAPVVPDMRYYGLGTFPPKGKTPFRIRRRE
ncbi:MAG: hypothetical protein M1830_006730 [Pleopsidium flavum]|nr:MAG: hypothetical protein M1830_006730 [Pleopsidium flavum]